MINTNFKIAMGIMLFIFILIIISLRRKEGYGVFSHRGNLWGIKNQARAHYTLQELDYQNPSDYWDYDIRKSADKSIYDKHIKSYHAKRFDPALTQ